MRFLPFLSVALALAGLAPPALARLSAPQTVQPPPGWHGGDPHEVIQVCPQPGGMPPPDRPVSDVYAEMLAEGLGVVDVLVYVASFVSCDDYTNLYAPNVTGIEDPVTQGDPDHFLQFGVEIVGGTDPACDYAGWGHIVGLGIDDGHYLFGADYPAPNLAFLRAQQKGVTGYAHVSWPEGTRVPQDFPPIDPSLSRLYPALAPTDAALHRVDLISTTDVGHMLTQISPHPWWGLYYKLLSAGIRVSLTSATVGQCYQAALGPLDRRTYVKTEAGLLDHDLWLDGILAGRTTIADGGKDFLLLQVDGADVGSEVQLGGPASVTVTASLTVAEPRQTTLEIVQDSAVVRSDPVDLTAPGTHVFQTTLDVTESGWIAARTAQAHTAAVFTIVGGKPLTDPASAGYFHAFADHVAGFLDALGALCDACPTSACPACQGLEQLVGVSEGAIRADLAEGQKVFAALRDYELPLPRGAQRYGVATPSCLGRPGIGVRGKARAGGSVRLTCFNAPPGALGSLLVGAAPQVPPILQNDALVFVDPLSVPAPIAATSNEGGYVEVQVSFPATSATVDVFCQFLFPNPPACPGPGASCASDALQLVVPRLYFAK